MVSSRTEHEDEREDRYEVGLGFALPKLQELLPTAGQIEQDETIQESVFYDTAERDLQRQHLTLQRRTGDIDTGWQLTVPADKTPTEIVVPSSDGDAVPDELASWVAGVALGNPMHPVTTLTTVRHTYLLLDADACLLAKITDDVVHGTVAGDGALATEWREVTVALGEAGGKKMRRAIGRSLTRGGGRPLQYPSKLARALADRHRGGEGRADGKRDPGGTDPSTSPTVRVVTDYLEAQVQAIVAGDVWLRRGLDAVHPTRVGIRRFRSTLRVFEKVLEPAARTTLDAELSWYAGLLGEVRDRQVQRARFTRAVAALPSELVMGPVAARIEEDLLAEQLHHLTDVRTVLDGERYRALLATLAQWRTAPPFTDDAAADPGVIRTALRRAERKALKRVAAAAKGADEEALHRARKAAKRARYAAELAEPVLGKKAKKKVARYKKMQEVLGEHQDSVVASGILRRLGARAGTTPGENGFTFGLLYGLELQAVRQARMDAARLM
ncbi:CYTH and CHAD domain-containing protein [Rhodococcus chondri]|uniref:CYTH and CHAD domain-containing protein n=1 Tax=Rhodococcus chondri TaxID=3065941 RepID=A0ABU7JYA8_9NOCA|nr:CYTH and CHAD domain-containing protein [Rhodococcus sp. CC-R104]MEE2034995.1 CYTH and CHAD domain-containing protein [Rhodococcus sp. CC-R104]